jgi:hypothetical protein
MVGWWWAPQATAVASCEPPAGKTYLTIGQDLAAIQDYVTDQFSYSLHRAQTRQKKGLKLNEIAVGPIPPLTVADFLPAATMVYTDIQTLSGLKTPIDYGSGVQDAVGVTLEGQVPGLQIGLWLNGTTGCADIMAGKLKAEIDSLMTFLTNESNATKVFLRVGYEFDNPGFGYNSDPALYTKAYVKIVNSCRFWPACRNKVIFVWHSWGAGLPANTTLADFYPGDDVVDWVGVSIFSQFYQHYPSLGSISTLNNVLDFANFHNKPTMIAESTPFGGVHVLKDPWRDWYHPVLKTINAYDIGMWSYIDCDWDSLSMWNGTGFGDSRLAANQTITRLWQKYVLKNPRFVQHAGLCAVGPAKTVTRVSKKGGKKPFDWTAWMSEGKKDKKENVDKGNTFGWDSDGSSGRLDLLAARGKDGFLIANGSSFFFVGGILIALLASLWTHRRHRRRGYETINELLV